MKVFFHTLGCKVNQYETAAMESQFKEKGFTLADNEDEADVIIVNSCSVTDSGDRKSLRKLRRGKESGKITVLCGCFPQAFPQKAAEADFADIVTGNKDRASLPQLVLDFYENRQRLVNIAPHCQGEEFEALGSHQPQGRTRAYLKIEDGCQRFCSYCIIPHARGPVRSLPLSEVRRSCETIASQGFKEIVLTGINLSCYGQDMGLNLADAVEAAAVEGIERIRLGSVEPDLLTDEIIKRLAAIPKLCAHFHLALQSGCDRTLAAMRRRYNTKMYKAVAQKLREAFDSPSFTTDIIVGFPGETDSDFGETVDFVDSFDFLKCHIFPYSRRAGTPAASMEGQLTKAQKENRVALLTEKSNQSRTRILRQAIGKKYRIISENPDQSGMLTGFTDEYYPVLINRKDVSVGDCGIYTATSLQNDFLIVE